MHVHNCRYFHQHLRLVMQSLRAHCLAPGGSESIWKYLKALVRSPGVSGRIACCFWTDLHFADVSVALNDHAERCSHQTPGDLYISNYTILNTFIVDARQIWQWVAHPDLLNPLSVMNWNWTQIRLMTRMHFPTWNMLITSLTRSLNHRHLLSCDLNLTLASALSWAIILLSHGSAILRVPMRRIHKTIPTTHLRCVWSINVSSVGSRRSIWRHTMTTCWRKKTLLGISYWSTTRMASSSEWLACQMIRLWKSRNYTLLRIWHGMTITNALSNTVVETSSQVYDSWCSSQPTPGISFMPFSGTLPEILHWNASILKFTLWTGGWRNQQGEILKENHMLVDVKSTLTVEDILVPLNFMSDRIHFTNFAGDKKERPEYMTIGNLFWKICQMPST